MLARPGISSSSHVVMFSFVFVVISSYAVSFSYEVVVPYNSSFDENDDACRASEDCDSRRTLENIFK